MHIQIIADSLTGDGAGLAACALPAEGRPSQGRALQSEGKRGSAQALCRVHVPTLALRPAPRALNRAEALAHHPLIFSL